MVLASAGDLELALQNVIDNALRNARTDPVHVSVHVGQRHVSIDVADDGPESRRRACRRTGHTDPRVSAGDPASGRPGSA